MASGRYNQSFDSWYLKISFFQYSSVVLLALVLLVAVTESRPGRGRGNGRERNPERIPGFLEDRPTREPGHSHGDSSEEVTNADGEIVKPTREPHHTHADGVTHSNDEKPHRRPHRRPQRNRD